ncbi:enoyl-CoA hydratase/isomerase family protein [Mycobacterium cookii]|uniref:Enoyl-CoA hydratase n=1 Tax=Mycobacterium cookii TaxID=1775 RepID=A0A7I7KS40_9MYCO|nr:enoyl-CoA hydratase-related protein [Mycobacterium cookii]MCV7331116.1 enoyl-CoA hydratase/isomerase family protein [Mycobacterium cookii]BBX44930.1 enoyl-CoA hydratase [Mycobacterium cookii]
MILKVDDENRVRTLTLNRPDALNAFNEALYEATAAALTSAAADPDVAVVLLTGAGRAFSAGNDLKEMQARITDPEMANQGSHFTTMIEALTHFPKPLVCAVNGVGVGIGATILGYADLVFMSSMARLKCPFTSLGVAPEAASSYLMPQLIGRQNAAWLLMSSEWVDADEARSMGLAWKVCEPDQLIAQARSYAETLASRPIPSLIAVKQSMVEPIRSEIAAATERENAHFAELLGGQANAAALADFTAKKQS